jgi:LL-diaminopimelate aminotransferase
MKSASVRMHHLTTHFFATLGARIEVMKLAGVDVIRLDEGSPDLPPAPHIIETLCHSAASPRAHGYQSQKGTVALRTAWAEMYRRVHVVELDPDREVVPLLGSKEGIFHFISAFIDPGDVVLIPDLAYITYTRATQFAGGDPYFMPLRPENAFLPDLQAIPRDVLRRAKLLWLNYPNNPTAAVASREYFASAVEFARTNNLLLCHDAAYTQVTFDGYRAPSLLEIPGAKEVAVEFNSLSKSHNMAGWRVGALVGNAEALRAFYTIKTNVDSGQFLPVMDACVAAMTGDQSWLEERNRVYGERRDVVLRALNALGLRAERPKASLYVWSPVPQGWTSLDFMNLVLDQAHVSLTPGTVFGESGEGYMRFSLTAPVGRLEEAMQRMTDAFRKAG